MKLRATDEFEWFGGRAFVPPRLNGRGYEIASKQAPAFKIGAKSALATRGDNACDAGLFATCRRSGG